MDAIERERDVITELDRWLDNSNDSTTTIERCVVLRARDEIVALRKLTDGNWVWKQITGSRMQALEEAAQACGEPAKRLREELGWSAEAELLERYAAAIRALKGKGDE